MNTINTISDILVFSFQDLWYSFSDFFPRLFGALVVLFIGWALAGLVGRLVRHLVDALKIDLFIEKLGLKHPFRKVDLEFHVNGIFAWLVKWFLIAVTLIAVADILEWQQITDFLNLVVSYLPNVLIAVVILLIGILLGNFVREVVFKAVRAASFASADLLASVAKWSILIFSLMAALVQLEIASSLIQILFTGVVFMLALAGGLAFGLGGKEQAAKFLQRLRDEISEK